MSCNVFYVVNRDKESGKVILTPDEIVNLFKTQIKNLEKNLRTKFPCEYEFVQADDVNGNPLRFGYLWISNKEVYNMCKGLNPNGTERIKEIKNNSSPKLLEKKLREFMLKPVKPGDLWADIQEEEDKIIEMYSGTKKVKLDKLIDLDKWMEKYTNFVITPYVMKKVNKVLIAHNIPEFVTEKMIKDVFSKFTNKFKVIFIDTQKFRICKVIFANPYECCASLEMRRKVKLTDRTGKQSCVLIFKFDNREDKVN